MIDWRGATIIVSAVIAPASARLTPAMAVGVSIVGAAMSISDNGTVMSPSAAALAHAAFLIKAG